MASPNARLLEAAGAGDCAGIVAALDAGADVECTRHDDER
jgi:hypothetical protein